MYKQFYKFMILCDGFTVHLLVCPPCINYIVFMLLKPTRSRLLRNVGICVYSKLIDPHEIIFYRHNNMR